MKFKITYIADTELKETFLIDAKTFANAEIRFQEEVTWNTIVNIEKI